MKTVSGGYKSYGAAAGFVAGTIVYTMLDADRVKVGLEITRRYQERQIPASLYQKAFGDNAPLPARYVFRP